MSHNYKSINKAWQEWLMEQENASTEAEMSPEGEPKCPPGFNVAQDEKGTYCQKAFSSAHKDQLKVNTDPNDAGEGAIAAKQKARGMEVRSPDEAVSFLAGLGEEWNNNPATSFLFYIPGAKGAPEDYGMGALALDLVFFALGTGVAGGAYKLAAKAIATKATSVGAVKGALAAEALYLKALQGATAKMTTGLTKAIASGTVKSAATAPLTTPAKDLLHRAKSYAEKNIEFGITKKTVAGAIDAAGKVGKKDELLKDPGFVKLAKRVGFGRKS